MTNIQINGVRFKVATAWEVDVAQFSFAAVEGGPETDSRAEFDPTGPNAGSGNLIGATINSWTNTLIDIDYDGASHPAFLRSVRLYDVTQAQSETFDLVPDQPTGPADPNDYPLLEGICSPFPDIVRFTGQRFLTANLGPVGYVIPRMADYASGVLLNGANMIVELANVAPNWVLVTHTDNVIELQNADFTNVEPSAGPGDFVVNGVAFHDQTTLGYYYYEAWGDPSPYSAPIDGAGCPANVTITNVTSAGPNTIAIDGTDLDQVERFRVFDNFALDQYYYDSSGPNAGLNPPGSTVTVYGPSSVIIGDTANAGLIVTQVQARTNPGDVVADEWFGTAIVAGTYNVTYNSGTDELTIDQTDGILDLTTVDFINYAGNGNGQLNTTFFTANSATQIVVPNAAFVLNGGTLTGLDFIDGVTVDDLWTGSVNLF